jgi:hypothetical protein
MSLSTNATFRHYLAPGKAALLSVVMLFEVFFCCLAAWREEPMEEDREKAVDGAAHTGIAQSP